MQEFAYDIDCHMAVLTELTMPEVQMESALPTEQGWGKYDLTDSSGTGLRGNIHG